MRASRWLLVIAFCLLLLAPGVLHALLPDAAFSASENRLLAGFPRFSQNSVFSGRFMEGFEEYFADQFPWRDAFAWLRTKLDQALFRTESNGVYFGRDGYLFGQLDNQAQLAGNLQQLVGLMQRLPPELAVSFLAVPTSAAVHAERLPKHAPAADQAQILQEIRQQLPSRVRCPDLLQLLSQHAAEYIYYRTDHHWTTLGAFYAYQALFAGALSQEEFTRETVRENFYGTYFYRVLDRRFGPDSIVLWHPVQPREYQITLPDAGGGEIPLYDYSKLETNDKYAVFLGGNHALAILRTSSNTGRQLLLVKDSYANCLIPFLANHFDTIHIVDPRFFPQDLAEYAARAQVDEVLFVYGLASLTD